MKKRLKSFRKSLRSFKPASLVQVARRRWKRTALVVAVVLVALFAYGRATAQPQGITAATVTRQDLLVTVSANGKVDARRMADLKFAVPSKVTWVGVKNGDAVSAWQGIASLDTRTLTKNLQAALIDYSKERNAFDQTQDDYQNRTPQQALNDQMKRILQNNQYDLDKAVNSVELQSLAAEQASLVSPIAGTVTATNGLIPGLNLTAGDLATKYIRVVDTSSLYFLAKVDEIDYSKVHDGQAAGIAVDAYPGKTCNGTVSFVSPDGQETTGGVVTVAAEVDLKDCPLDLAVGLNGQAEFVTDKVTDALVIPKKYLVTQEGKTSVWVQTGATTRDRTLVAVTTGKENASDVAITSGLSEGDTVLFIPS